MRSDPGELVFTFIYTSHFVCLSLVVVDCDRNTIFVLFFHRAILMSGNTAKKTTVDSLYSTVNITLYSLKYDATNNNSK